MEEKKGKEFEKIANPNKSGKFELISLKKLPVHLKVTNGSSYTRKNSYLDKKYYLEKIYLNGKINTHTDLQKSGIGKGKLLSIKLDGKREEGNDK